MADKTYRLGTRKSVLAKTQTHWVKERLEAQGLSLQVVETESQGDQDRTTPLYEMELDTPGIFTKHLETELLQGRIDLAVHSLKDLPTTQPPGLRLACVPQRVLSQEYLFVRSDLVASDQPLSLGQGAVVGTSSLRREALLLSVRPDLKVVPIRGNVPTRLRAVIDGKVSAVLLAAAGVSRLGLSHDGLTCVELPEDVFISAPGQGALAIETRDEQDPFLFQALAQIHDPRAHQEVTIERRVLQLLEGGCTLPIGVRVTIGNGEKPIRLKAFLGILGSNRQWVSFQYYETQEKEADAAIEKTVSFFKEVMNDG